MGGINHPCGVCNFVLIETIWVIVIRSGSDKTLLGASILFYLLYAYLRLRLLIINVWKRKNEIKAIPKQNQPIKNWSIFLYVSFIAIVTIRIATGFFIQRPELQYELPLDNRRHLVSFFYKDPAHP